VHALREYDVTDIALGKRGRQALPQFHVTPGYAWDKSGLRQDTLDDTLHDTLHDNELGVSFELPIFNRHEGPIGEALARRKLAGEHLQAVQAELFEEIERAERAWPQPSAHGGKPTAPRASPGSSTRALSAPSPRARPTGRRSLRRGSRPPKPSYHTGGCIQRASSPFPHWKALIAGRCRARRSRCRQVRRQGEFMRHALLPPLLACIVLLPAFALADTDDDNDSPPARAPGTGLVLTSAQQEAVGVAVAHPVKGAGLARPTRTLWYLILWSSSPMSADS